MTEPTSTPATGHDALAHPVPLWILAAVFAALLVFTGVTVAATWVEWGTWNLLIAMGIATIKASLVALYFMHLRYDSPFNAFIFIVGLAFVALFICLTLLDTFQYQPEMIPAPASLSASSGNQRLRRPSGVHVIQQASTVEHGQNIDPLGLVAVDDPIRPSDQLADKGVGNLWNDLT